MSPLFHHAESRERDAPADRRSKAITEPAYVLYAIATEDAQTVARDWHGGEVSAEILQELERRLALDWYEAIDTCLTDILNEQTKENTP